MTLFDLVIIVLEQAIIFSFISNYLQLNHKYNRFILIAFILMGSILVLISNVVFGLEGLFKFVFILVCFAFSVICSENSIVEKIFVSLYPFVLVGVINSLLTVISSYILFGMLDVSALLVSRYFAIVIVSSKLLLLLSLAITSQSRKRYDKIVNNREMMYLLCLILFVQIIFILVERFLYTDSINEFEVVSIIGMLFIFVILIVYFFFDSLDKENKVKLNLLSNQMKEFEEKRYLEMKEMSDATSRLKHNLKHILSNAEIKIRENKYEEAITSIHMYLDEINKVSVYKNFNSLVLDFLINKMINEVSDKKYSFKYAINLKHDVDINDNDYMILLGNVLENAVEHSKGDRSIELIIQQKNEYASFTVTNTVDMDFDSNRLRNGEKINGHGYGIKSIDEIISRNKGYLFFKVEGCALTCSIMLRLKQ